MDFFEKLLKYKLCNKAKTVFWWMFGFLIFPIVATGVGGALIASAKKSGHEGARSVKIQWDRIFAELLFNLILYLSAIFYAEKTCTDKNYPDTPSWLIVIIIVIINVIKYNLMKKILG